jgi:hypothetical protein
MGDILYRLHGEGSATVCRHKPPTVPLVRGPHVFDEYSHWQVNVGSCFGHGILLPPHGLGIRNCGTT